MRAQPGRGGRGAHGAREVVALGGVAVLEVRPQLMMLVLGVCLGLGVATNAMVAGARRQWDATRAD